MQSLQAIEKTVSIRFYNRAREFIGEIDTFTSAVYLRRWESFGEFEIHFTEDRPDLFVEGYYITINNDQYRNGVIQYYKNDSDGYEPKSLRDIVIKGFSLLYLLYGRITVPPKTNNGYRIWYNKPVEDIMQDLVAENVVSPVDGKRKIPEMSLASNQHRGVKITFQSRLKYLTDEFLELSKQSGLAPAVRFDTENKRFVFEVLEGKDCTASLNNPNSYVFAKSNGKVSKRTYTYSSEGSKNMAYIGGQGDGDDREIVMLHDERTGIDRKEMFIDARDIAAGETNTLLDRGSAKLLAVAPSVAYEFDADTQDYGRFWDLGDTATYVDENGFVENNRITQVREVYENHLLKIDPVFGYGKRTMVDNFHQNGVSQTNERVGISGNFKQLFAENATIINLVAEKADIKDLTVVTASIEVLKAQTAEITLLVADKASIDDLTAVTASVSLLKADLAQLDTAIIGKADIDLANIKNGCITTAMIGTGVIGTSQIADASITEGKIVSLTANKITAGRLDAAEIEVVNLNAANITVGTINGVQIAPGAITGDKLGQQVNDLISGAVSGAQQAQTTADGKNKIYYQNTQPGLVGNKKGDTWFDTANGYRTYIWNGTAWSLSPFGSGAIADDAVTLAKVGADLQSFMDGINTKATTAQTSADGKNTVFYQGTTPSTVGRKVGDTWFNSADGNRVYTWNGSTWAAAPFGTNALGNLSVTNALIASLDAGKITAGVLAAARIGAGSITADKLASKSITVGQINDAAIQAINDKINIGARNLLQNSGTPITNTAYLVQSYTVVGLKPNTVYTVVMNGNTSTTAKYMGVWFNAGVESGFAFPIITTAKTQVIKVTSPPTLTVQYISIYQPPSSTAGSATINWIAMYEGDIKPPMDWTPAPEDTDASIAQNSIANWCYNNNLTYINGGKIYTGTVTANEIAANAIVAGKLAANAVTASAIIAGAITADKIAANSVNASKIVAGCITAAQLAASTITGDKIAAGTISAGLLAANSVTADKIVADAITTAKIAAKAVTANEIAVGTITAAQIAANAITATQLAAGAVTAAKIAAGQITADKIAAGAITADKFYGTAITSKNYVANSTGTLINLANGTIDTKNFKVDSAGNVAMTGALTMQGAQTMTVRNASAVKVGHLAFSAVSGQTWSPGALSVYGDGLLQIAAGDTKSTKAFVSGWAGGYQLFEMSKEGTTRSAWIGTSALARIGVNSAQTPQIYAEGCTKILDFAVAGGCSKVAGTLNNIVYNSMGKFCLLSFTINGNVNAGTHTTILTVPSGYQPASDVYVAGVGGIYGWFQIWLAKSGELKVWHPDGMTSMRGTVLYYLP